MSLGLASVQLPVMLVDAITPGYASAQLSAKPAESIETPRLLLVRISTIETATAILQPRVCIKTDTRNALFLHRLKKKCPQGYPSLRRPCPSIRRIRVTVPTPHES
ncbi:hypothetical protein LZ32DRAFT_172838 [Colletotrichum eremochloae]|nr:hypothetical protein LZ32DRAFT_172838 [Colletotrichum eremochloae]